MDSISHYAATTSVMDENPNILIPSMRDLFLSTYQPHQPWSLPDSIIYYISKNPSTSNVYQKLIQSCKYFFIKNSILVIPHLHLTYENNEWKTLFNRKCVDHETVSCKLWVTDFIYCCNNAENVDDQYISTSILPKIFQCDAKDIAIWHQNIGFNDLVFLSSKCKKAYFFNVTVMDENGSAVAVEKFFEAFPAVKDFCLLAFSNANVVTTKTAQELIKIPYFANLDRFELSYIPESFDITTFYAYIKKNKKTQIRLTFARSISQQYRNRLQTIVYEIIQANDCDYRPPYIYFPDMDGISYKSLYDLNYRS